MGGDVHSVVLTTTQPRGARLRLVGDLDEAAVERLRALLDDVAVPGADVRLDLSRAGRLPLPVLRALAAAHRRLTGGSGLLVLTGASPAAARALRTSGLDRVLTIESAPAAIRPAGAAAC